MTKKDFIHKYNIARKETKETKYWLSLVEDTNLKLKPRTEKLTKECEEIVKIISTIIYKTTIKK